MWSGISGCWILVLGSKCINGMILFSELVGCSGIFTHTSDLDSAEQTQGHRPWHQDCHEHQGPLHPQPLNPYSTGGSHSLTTALKHRSMLHQPQGERPAGSHIMPGQRRTQYHQTSWSSPSTMPCAPTPARSQTLLRLCLPCLPTQACSLFILLLPEHSVKA